MDPHTVILSTVSEYDEERDYGALADESCPEPDSRSTSWARISPVRSNLSKMESGEISPTKSESSATTTTGSVIETGSDVTRHILAAYADARVNSDNIIAGERERRATVQRKSSRSS